MRSTARRTSILIGTMLAAMVCGGAASAKPADDLIANGFFVFRTTKVTGDFDGCDRGSQVVLADGGVFTCSSSGHMHTRDPKALVLKSKAGKYKLVIGDVVFDGVFS